jgi:hypothetical protein
MIPSPYRFEPTFTDAEYAKLGVLALRWSHIEHIIGNCLKVLLRLTDEEAIVIVFPMSGEQRITKIHELSKLAPLPEKARIAFDELRAVMKGIQYVRNTVIHAICGDDEEQGQVFHLRSKKRSIAKAEVFSVEELTNYAGHLVLALRYALGFKDNAPPDYTIPARPPVPDFLRSIIQFK